VVATQVERRAAHADAGRGGAVAVGVLAFLPRGVDTAAPPDSAVKPTPTERVDPLAAARVPVVEVDGVDFLRDAGTAGPRRSCRGRAGQASVTFSFTATGDVYEWANVCRSEDGAYDGDPSPTWPTPT